MRRTLWQVKCLTIPHRSASFSQFTTVPSLIDRAMTSRATSKKSLQGTNLDVFALERQVQKWAMNDTPSTSHMKKGTKSQPQFNRQSMLSNVFEGDIDDMSWLNHIVVSAGKITHTSEETKNYADDDSMRTRETANSSQGTHVDVCAIKRELNRIVLGAGNITLVLEETEDFSDDHSKKTIKSEILRILSTAAKINNLLKETAEDSDRNDSKAEDPPLSGKRAEEPPLSIHAKSGPVPFKRDAIYALGKHETTRLLFDSKTIDDDVFRRCCDGHQILLNFKSKLAKIIELHPEMYREMCGVEFLNKFILKAEYKGRFLDIEKGIEMTMTQKRSKLQHLVRAAKRMKQQNVESLGAYCHDDESDLSSNSK